MSICDRILPWACVYFQELKTVKRKLSVHAPFNSMIIVFLLRNDPAVNRLMVVFNSTFFS